MVVATASLLVACTSPGTLTLQGPFTIPLPTINTAGPSTSVDLLPQFPGTCVEVMKPTGILIRGASVIVPSISVHFLTGTIDVPNIQVKIPRLTVNLPSVQVKCFGGTLLNLSVFVKIPASVFLRDAHLDLPTGTLSLINPSVTIKGVTLGFSGTNLAISVPITLTIPIPTVHVPLSGL